MFPAPRRLPGVLGRQSITSKTAKLMQPAGRLRRSPGRDAATTSSAVSTFRAQSVASVIHHADIKLSSPAINKLAPPPPRRFNANATSLQRCSECTVRFKGGDTRTDIVDPQTVLITPLDDSRRLYILPLFSLYFLPAL